MKSVIAGIQWCIDKRLFTSFEKVQTASNFKYNKGLNKFWFYDNSLNYNRTVPMEEVIYGYFMKRGKIYR